MMDAYYNYNDAMFYAIMQAVGVIFFISLVVYILIVIAQWKIFDKAGIAGWKSLIPIYNVYCFYKITWGSGWLFLVLLVPLVGFVFSIITQYRLAKSFDKGIGFTIGLILLSPVFLLILGFGNAEYNELQPI